MPTIDLFCPAGALTDEQRSEVVEGLTTAMLAAERAPQTEFFRGITWVLVHELPAAHVFAAGRPVEQPIYRVNVTVPDGALSDRRKQELVESATKVIADAVGLTEADGLRVWVIVHEVPDGNWGAAGNVVRFEHLLGLAAREREAAAAPAEVS